ncbi:MAG TPA: methyltransferase domain-containing protein [Candidatus Acidoferrum sp.]|nr:methyltransferase domain-containing protein [Candidatus Acidoferrum sp.]
MTDSMNVFDRRLVRRHRDRAAADLGAHDFLFREVAERLADRLDDVTRKFPRALDLGCHGGEMAAALRGRGGIETLAQCDLSTAMARQAAVNGHATLVADEELLPFAPESFDLVISNLSLHWVNDLPGCLLQIRHCLKPDGLLLAAMLGGDTLQELRQSLMEAELAEAGGVSPRLSPFADLRDAGGLLQRAGFALPVIDGDRLTVSYPDILKLMRDLRGMGETNAVRARTSRPVSRAVAARADEIYRQRFGDGAGRLAATFQIIYLTAWAPAAGQQRALAPGSARTRLADALGTTEISAGDKARPR